MVNSNLQDQAKTNAKELIMKHGKNALSIAKSKVDSFPKDQYSRERDYSLMLLTEVEKLLKS